MKLSPTTMTSPRRAFGLVRSIAIASLLVALFLYLRPASFSRSATGLQPPFPPSPPAPPSPASPPPPPSQPPTEVEHSPEPEPKPQPPARPPKRPKKTNPKPAVGPGTHPIDELIEVGEKYFDDMLKKETKDLHSAAAAYRERRGRHPPPGFDQWFKFAQEKNIVMVEDFFDQIYHDLRPFWAIEPWLLREEARKYEMVINIRDHNASTGSDWFWTQHWLDLIKTIEHMVPDMDLALNAMDEPRVVSPWEKINQLVEQEGKSRRVVSPMEVVSEYQVLPPPTQGNASVEITKKHWEREGSYWEIATRGCPPDSLARKAEIVSNFTGSPVISLAHTLPHSYKGYVSNYTLSTDFCNQPDLQTLEGIMISPLSIASTKQTFPLFGGSKLPTNNEILLPAPVYWSEEERFSGGGDHGLAWDEKDEGIVWRGVATGGRNKAHNWRGFQRHRFVAMTNSTKLAAAETWQTLPENWAMPSSSYDLAAQQEGRLGAWAEEWADTGFVDLMCHPPVKDQVTCNYTSPYFNITKGIKMSEQFSRKYLPDIDGNSFSGRYRGFLMSTSLPIKATIFREWHDSRLVPWVHFVPMDNRFGDFFGIMEYFLGYDGGEGGLQRPHHDDKAAKMANAGKEWAEKVLRKEDMQVYVLRLLLEYARVTNDARDMMGWVSDLI